MNEKMKKSGFVTLIGRPNVGKSTLMNHLIGQKIAITSNKPQTTRKRIQTVYTDECGQVVFLDTPGMHKAKSKLGEYMVGVANKTLDEVDVVLWLVEPDPYIGPGDREIAKKLASKKTPVILIVNKMDTVSKDRLNETIRAYEKEGDFDKIIAVSALRATNVPAVMDAVFGFLPYGPMYYDEETVTEQPVREIVAEIIREKALRLLQDEIPHGIAVEIESMKERKNGMYDVEAAIICERESHKGIIIGKGGQMLKRIGTQARIDAEGVVGAKINLKIFVKVRKEWRDNQGFLKSLGYDPSDLK